MLANGRDGLGGAYTPEMFRGLDRALRAAIRSSDIDFAALRGKTVGVIGAGASAVDNAAEALEHGAARVAMLVRRAGRAAHQQGHGHRQRGLLASASTALTDAQKW